MIKTNLVIEGIPAILWGKPSKKIFVAVHGNMSCKDDEAILIFAEEAINRNYQVLSFDLPEHGDRKGQEYACVVQNCVNDLNMIMNYAQTISDDISLFACSMGAYFSLLAYRNMPLKQCLFLSPVVNMELIIKNMMEWFDVSEERLKVEQEIETPIGQKLYWDYYCYVKSNPIDSWDKATSILYGSNDDISDFNEVSIFVKRNHCNLQIVEQGEHYFHTEEQLSIYRRWLCDRILK